MRGRGYFAGDLAGLERARSSRPALSSARRCASATSPRSARPRHPPRPGRARRPGRGRRRHRRRPLRHQRPRRHRARQGPPRRGRRRSAAGRRGRHHLRPQRPDRPRDRHPEARRWSRRSSSPCVILIFSARAQRPAADRRPARLGACSRSCRLAWARDPRHHHVPRRDRHRHRRATVDAEIAMNEGPSQAPEHAPKGMSEEQRQTCSPRPRAKVTPGDLLLAADHRRRLHPRCSASSRPGRAPVQAARLHQDLRHAGGRAAQRTPRAGAARPAGARQDLQRGAPPDLRAIRAVYEPLRLRRPSASRGPPWRSACSRCCRRSRCSCGWAASSCRR